MISLQLIAFFSRDYCARYGEVTECIIMRDRENRSRGFAFVSFKGLFARLPFRSMIFFVLIFLQIVQCLMSSWHNGLM